MDQALGNVLSAKSPIAIYRALICLKETFSQDKEVRKHILQAITKIGNRGIGESRNRGIGESGNRGIGESGNRGIGEYGNGKRYRYAVCGMIYNYHIQLYSPKINGIPHGI